MSRTSSGGHTPALFDRERPTSSAVFSCSRSSSHLAAIATRRFLHALILLALAAAGHLPGVQAHEIRPTIVDVEIVDPESDTSQGSVTAQWRLRLNLEALIAGIGTEHDDTDDAPASRDYDALRELSPDALKQRFNESRDRWLAGLELRAHGSTEASPGTTLEPVITTLSIPPAGDLALARDSVLILDTVLPPDTRALQWSWDRGAVVIRAGETGTEQEFSQYLREGQTSDVIPIALLDASSAENVSNAEPGGEVTNAPPRPVSTIFLEYIQIGFVHILPAGLDHIVFVVGLFLLTPRLAALTWQVSLFTLAHSVTLAIGVLGLWTPPAGLVEPAIALSIVLIGIDNLANSLSRSLRAIVIFVFGLLHGLGFASVLSEIGLAGSAQLTSLLGFNIGVEIGQLTVILLCFAVVGWWFREKPWYRQRVTIPASIAISVIGLVWFIERVTGWQLPGV